ncbi:MAG: site-specific DNA-methyltransferase [Candidatus Lokiarchaeota archaeon]|nr:site-specific DNA-methyltransferase [Candidatus Lokiarchaeota archaeon]
MSENRWQVKEQVKRKNAQNPDFNLKSLEYITQNQIETEELVKNANKSYQEGNFGDCAKNFRQLARIIKQLENTIEIKGNYDIRNTLNDLTGKEWLRHTKSWLIVDGKPSDIVYNIKNHPASFPPTLASHFIEFFTKKGDWVFDPFMGIGSVLKSAQDLERNCWGIELNQKYQEFAHNRLTANNSLVLEVTHGDARNAVPLWETRNFPTMDFVITSPPYWDMLGKSRGGVMSTSKQRVENGLDETYSDDPNDLGNISDVDIYLDQLYEIFANLKKILSPNAYLLVVMQNIRKKDGEMEPIAWNFAKKMKKSYSLRQEFIWCQDQKFMGIWGYPKIYVSNVHHHYCLVFQN